jgi:hypothetical protein
MATCLETITNALILRKIIGVGKSPKSAETALGLVALQSLYDQWRTGGMFGTLEDVYLEGDDIALEGKRYFVPTGYTLTDATSVYTDEDGVVRQPHDMAMYEALTQAGTQTAKLYDRTEWVDLIGLASGDTAPLSGRNALGLAACLATSGGFVAAFGGEASPELIALSRHFLRNIMDKGGSTQADRTGDYF